MVYILDKLVMAAVLVSVTLGAAVPDPTVDFVPAPLSSDVGTKITYRQASKEDILRRADARRVGSRALQPRQSARVYPACSPSSDPAYIPQSGFANFPGYSIDTNSANTISGNFNPASPEIACVMLCNITPGCTAGYWAGGYTCWLKQGTVAGTAMVPRPGTDRVAFLRGDCSSLEGQINNSTIMDSCCNNTPPTTIARCTYSGYQNLGNYCLRSRVQFTTANRLTTTTVAGGTNFDTVLKNCAQYCTNYSANARASGTEGCTVAAASYNTNGGPNCMVYGGRPKTMVASDADYSFALVAGTCEQANANGIPTSPARNGCYSPTSGS